MSKSIVELYKEYNRLHSEFNKSCEEIRQYECIIQMYGNNMKYLRSLNKAKRESQRLLNKMSRLENSIQKLNYNCTIDVIQPLGNNIFKVSYWTSTARYSMRVCNATFLSIGDTVDYLSLLRNCPDL